MRRPQPRIAEQVGEALARMHRAGRGFPLRARERAVARRAGRRCSRRPRRAPTKSRRGLASETAEELARSYRQLARGPARGRHPRRSVHRQRVLSRRQALRPDRLLFRLRRLSRLRPRDLPQRLVLRAERRIQFLEGQAMIAGYRARPPAGAGARSRRCRCWRAARRCASC